MISASIIAKNEESTLGRCLQSVRPFVDEIVVVDTGSSDGTLSAAQGLVDRLCTSELFHADTPIEHFDFSAARNEALDLCSHDWILSIDADETFTGDPLTLRHALQSSELPGLLLTMTNGNKPGAVAWVPRLFRKSISRWSGACHELPTPWDNRATVVDECRIEHHSADKPGRIERNLTLLKKDMVAANRVDERFYQIADCYYAMGMKYLGEAIGYYETFINAVAVECSPILAYAMTRLGECYFKAGLLSKAVQLADEVIEKFPKYTRAYLLRSKLLYRVGQITEAIECLQLACGIPEPAWTHPYWNDPVTADVISAAIENLNQSQEPVLCPKHSTGNDS